MVWDVQVLPEAVGAELAAASEMVEANTVLKWSLLVRLWSVRLLIPKTMFVLGLYRGVLGDWDHLEGFVYLLVHLLHVGFWLA